MTSQTLSVSSERIGPSRERILEAVREAESWPDSKRPAADEHQPPGAQVGRYLVIDVLGSGGMGVVYRAYDPKLQREVALKCLRSAAIGEEARQRMLLEAHSMAKLSHPNVVAVFDVDAEGDQVLIAMELALGQTLRSWIKDGPHPWREVVQRFIAAGQGLAAAHAAGIVHRDFKPANVLLGEDDRPRVTDFGIARLRTGPDSSQSAGFDSGEMDRWAELEGLTQVGQVMGTPAYMAPEQHAAADLGPAADQYAFCVALWQGLTMERPFEAETFKRMVELKRKGPPAFPRGSSVPTKIVDAIVRGLAPEPADRWPSMHELLDALSHDPDEVRKRWALRGGGVALVGVSVLAVVGWQRGQANVCGGAGDAIETTWGPEARSKMAAAFEATDVAYADDALHRVEEGLDRYAEAWVDAREDACEATAVRSEQSGTVMDLRMACLDRVQVELAAVVDVLEKADAATLEKTDELVTSLPPLDRCTDVAALQAEVPPPDDPRVAREVETLRRQVAEARALEEAGRYSEALKLSSSLAEVATRVDYPPILTEIELVRADASWSVADHKTAESSLREALKLALEWGQWPQALKASQQLTRLLAGALARHEEASAFADMALGLTERGQFGPRQRAKTLVALASLDEARGNPASSKKRLSEALKLQLDALGPGHVDVAATRSRLAGVLDDLGEYDQAEREYRTVLQVRRERLGPTHPAVGAALNGLAVCLDEQGRYEESQKLLEEALEIGIAAFGREHPAVADSRNNLANLFERRGDFEKAEAEYRASLAIYERVLGAEHPDAAMARNNLANALYQQGEYAEAEREYREALRSRQETLAPTHPDIGASHNNVALTLYVQEKHGEAIEEYREAIRVWKAALGPEHPFLGFAHSNLALAHLAVDELDDAEREIRRSIEIRTAALGPEHRLTGVSYNNLGLVLEAAERREEALDAFRRAIAIYEKTLDADHPDLGSAHNNLADTLLELKRYDEALEHYEQGLAILEPALGVGHVRTSQSYTGLGRVWVGKGQPARAQPWLEKAWAALEPEQTFGVSRARAAFELAEVVASQPGGRQRAVALATEAQRAFSELVAPDHEERRDVEAWLQRNAPGTSP